MRIYLDKEWVIERDSGEIIRLTPNEASVFNTMLRREELWAELLFHIKDEELYESKRNEILTAKDEILDELMWSDEREPELDDSDVYAAIEQCVDLEDDDE